MSETNTNQLIGVRWKANAAAQRARFSDYELDPAHTITLNAHRSTTRVVWNGLVIAESDKAVELHERKHDPVFYFPQDDVRLDLLERTDHATHCPYKGDASYWSLNSNETSAENAVWAYESPVSAMAGITGFMAFYLDTMAKDFGLTLETD